MKKVFFLYYFLIFNCTFSFKIQNIELTPQEKSWINSNKDNEIKIFVDSNREIFNYKVSEDNKGTYPLLVDFIIEKTGLKLEIIEKTTEDFRESIDLGIPDLILGVEDYKRNSKLYDYITPPITVKGVVMSREGPTTIYSNKDLLNKRILYIQDDNIKNKFICNYPGSYDLISMPDEESSIASLISGEGDLYIDDFQDVLKNIVKKPENNLTINFFSKDITTEYYIGGKRKYQILLNIIKKILEKAEVDENSIYEETLIYLRDNLKLPTYLKNKKQRVFLPKDNYFFPVYYIDSAGQKKGFILNYLQEMGMVLGINFIFEEKKSPSESDINPFVIFVNDKPLFGGTFLTTTPYYELSPLIFSREEKGYLHNFEEFNHSRIAVLKGSILEKYLLAKGAENLIRFNTKKEVFNAVDDGKADFLIGGAQDVNYCLKKYNVQNIKVVGAISDKIDVRIGIKQDKKIFYKLLTLFEKQFYYIKQQNSEKFLKEQLFFPRDYKLSIILTLIFLTLYFALYQYMIRYKTTYKKLKRLTLSLIEALEKVNLYNDEDTGSHIKRLSKYSEFIAKELKLSKKIVKEIGLYASIHDIGKIGIPEKVLKKAGKLSFEEFNSMKKHTEIGYDIIKDLGIGATAENIVRFHHEKWDGSGYGYGLKGAEIPIEARIVALADVYDALRQKRVYKEALSHEDTVKMIKQKSGEHFDPKLVEIFLENEREFKEIFNNNTDYVT